MVFGSESTKRGAGQEQAMAKPKKVTTVKRPARPTLESVHRAALKLSHEDRVELIDLLSVSLDQKKLQAVDAYWAREIKRRSAGIDAGTAKLVSWEEVKAEARKRWQDHE